MINFLSSWVKNLSLALIVVSILEMLLPNNKTKKYIKMVMGLYILFSIIAPFVNNSNVLNFNIEDVYSDYSKEISSTSAASTAGEVNQASMDDRLNKLYKEQLESDITQKVEEKGYDVRKCKVDAHVSESDTGIESITIEIDGKNDNTENSNNSKKTDATENSNNSKKSDATENSNGSSKYSKNSGNTLEGKIVKEIQKIQKVEIDVSKGDDSEDTNSAITKTDVKMIKDFLTKEYGVSEKCLKIN